MELEHQKFFQKEYNKDYEGTKLFLNESALNSICAILGKNKHIDGLPKLEPLKDYAYIWEAMSETASECIQTNKQNNTTTLVSAQLAEERAKKERRKQFWTNVGTALLNGMASGVYAYMASQYQVSAPMNTVPQNDWQLSGFISGCYVSARILSTAATTATSIIDEPSTMG